MYQKEREENNMTYFILDEMGNVVTTDNDKVIAEAIASELGGVVVEL